ncbi:uncharacterized protein (TIGR00730 family) [Dysgonomonas sp. PH5-45]|uniref:LOG family protein n=1 Tax=unclassified Dysgonomonas TaxID=2630389 RepID=UPI00247347C1|nr:MULTISPECIES: TIGR00730 family Rossman fold protein [unclassified Dysgonomonas]MDH6353801.1 uncharacterized protein (TIGR00730 family) [Dysgonomonas sp. PH5-45]MDH6386703.1 uncharacterized protein (TIGR00730 family) [Dysgonomonas sp. PH5-37]
MEIKRIAVFCGSSSGDMPVYEEKAYELGRFLARNGIGLVYGGGKVGLMGAVANGALSVGGEVIGVIPEFMIPKELAHEGVTELIVTRDMHQRKAKMHELCDGVITLPGGFGTFEELFEVLTWGQLALHSKPIGFLNVDGYYNTLLKFLDETIEKRFVKPESRCSYVVSESQKELLSLMAGSLSLPENEKSFITTDSPKSL